LSLSTLRSQRLDAGHPQFGGLFHQPVHALVGGDAQGQMHGGPRFALGRVLRAELHLHIAAAHVHDGGFELAALAVEEGDGVAGLLAQHLHMARGTRRKREPGAALQRQGAIKARQHGRRQIRPKA
jgi:hypothetical protein